MKKLLILLVVSLCSLGFFSCQEDDTIKIGVILPLTGPASEIGNNILDGITIDSEYYDSTSSKKIKLIVEDSKLDAKQAISSANKLVTIDKVDAIIGLASSTEALAVAPICEKNKVVMISSTASTPLLSDAGDYIFRIYPSDVYDSKVLADYAKEIKKISILYLNNDFGVGLKNTFIENYKKTGGDISNIEAFLPDDTDFRTQLTKIKASAPDGLLVIAIDMQYLNIVKQIRELNIKSQILAPVTFDNPVLVERLGSAANGIVYSRPKYVETTNEQSTELKRRYRKLRDGEPALLTALGFDTYALYYNTLMKTDFIPSLAKDQLYKMEYNGASGRIIFDKNGDIIPEIELITINN